jgi:Flp pilus assembly protein TadD
MRQYLIASFLVFVVATGCQQSVRQSRLQEPSVAPASEKTSAAEPVNLKGNPYRAALLKEAMKGLQYENDEVTIDQTAATEVLQGLDRSRAADEFQHGIELLNRNDVIESIRFLTRAVLLEPDNAGFHTGLGKGLLVKQKLPQARAALNTALKLDPANADARFLLADVLNREGSYDLAMIELETLLDQDADYPKAHTRMAIWSYYAGQLERANEHLAIARALGQPVPPQFENLLAGRNITQPLNRGGSSNIVFAAEARADVSNGNAPGNETTASSTRLTPNEVVCGWNDYGNNILCGIGISQDYGLTFNDQFVRPPAAFRSTVEGDPMTCYDQRTGQMWAGAISFAANGGLYTARKEPGNNFFQPSVMAHITGNADKGWMACGVDPFNPNASRLYIAYNLGVVRSTNAGDSWSGPVSLPEFGLGLLPRVGPNGELYIVYWDLDDGVKLLRSFNGGQSLEGPFNIAQRMDVWGIDGTRFSGHFRVAPLSYLAVDPNNGTLYCVYFDTTSVSGPNRNVDLYFCKSTNQGLNWTVPVVINGDNEPPGDQFFPWLEVDERSRIHLMFYDTRRTPGIDDVTPALIEAYYSYSDDGGDSWNEQVMTNQQFSSANDGFGDFFIGDYLGMGIGGCYAYPCYLSTHEGVSNVYVRQVTDQLPYVATEFQSRVGQFVSGDQADLAASDDQRLIYRSFKPAAGINRDPRVVPRNSVRLEFSTIAPHANPCELRLQIEARVEVENLTQRIQLFDYQANQFVEVDSRPATTSDSVTEVILRDSPERFFEPDTRRVKAAATWKNESGPAPSRWEVGVDLVKWIDLSTNRQ